MTPLARCCPTRPARSSRSRTRSSSLSADWILAIRYLPCLRIGTFMYSAQRLAGSAFLDRHYLVAQQTLGELDPALQVADGVHLAQLDADRDQRLRDFRRESRDDDGRAEQPCGFNRLHEAVR